jgi:hypothetical protein
MDTTNHADSGPSAAGVPAPRGVGVHAKTLVGLVSILVLCAFTGAPNPQATKQELAERGEPLRECPSVVSADDRLLTERWAASEDCDKPLRTRVTDRFLGFTCAQAPADTVTCRAFLPPPGSRVFDTSRHFRCVDFAVADTESGIVFSRMREWVDFSKTCDWSRSGELPAMEVDFAGGKTCVMPGGLCISAGLLTPIGKVRLRQSIEKALREFGLVRSGWLGIDASPVPTHWSASPGPARRSMLQSTPQNAD